MKMISGGYSRENVSIESGEMRLVREISKFFGVDEDEETKHSWERRKHIHCSRYGKMKDGCAGGMPVRSYDTTDKSFDTTDGPTSNESFLQRDSSRQLSREEELAIRKSSTKNQHALSLLYQYARSKINVKPESNPSVHEGHRMRSFAKKDVNHPADDYDYDYPVNDYSDTKEVGERFFDDHDTTDAIDGVDSYHGDQTDHSYHSHQPSVTYNKVQDKVTSKDVTRKSSVRRSRISQTEPPRISEAEPPTITNRSSLNEQSTYKETFLDKLLNFNRKDNAYVDRSEVQHRPYFTYWVSFLQAVILIITLIVYPLAPIGVHEKQVEEDVLVSQNGILHVARVGQTVVENLWIGPSLETLILLGAKYAPCMRRDKLIFKKLAEERSAENRTGCCMQTMNSGCIQRLQSECSSSFTQFKENSVCGQDPKACLSPASVPPKEWSNSIIEWPICRKTLEKSNLDKEKFPHMNCKVTGHPCCIGTQAQCIITSQDYCRFRKGTFHPDKTLCSQVNCLTSTCGLLPFVNSEAPDQFYRLYLSLFIHAGILHYLVSLAFNLFVLRHAEKTFGWLRILLIYLLSGIGGNLWSGILIPYEPEVGPSGALFGVLSMDVILFIYQWSSFESPWISLARLCGILVVVFLPGILPYIDNFAHIFGFIYGCLLSPLFIRDIFRRRQTYRKILLAVCTITFLVLTIIGFVLFYNVQTVSSDGVKYFNCIPLTETFCQNYHQGHYLEPRTVNY